MALVSALVTVSMANASVCSRVEKMSWGYDIVIENNTEFEGFKEFKINGSRDLFYVVGGSNDRIFKSVVISGLSEYPKIDVIACLQ